MKSAVIHLWAWIAILAATSTAAPAATDSPGDYPLATVFVAIGGSPSEPVGDRPISLVTLLKLEKLDRAAQGDPDIAVFVKRLQEKSAALDPRMTDPKSAERKLFRD